MIFFCCWKSCCVRLFDCCWISLKHFSRFFYSLLFEIWWLYFIWKIFLNFFRITIYIYKTRLNRSLSLSPYLSFANHLLHLIVVFFIYITFFFFISISFLKFFLCFFLSLFFFILLSISCSLLIKKEVGREKHYLVCFVCLFERERERDVAIQ